MRLLNKGSNEKILQHIDNRDIEHFVKDYDRLVKNMETNEGLFSSIFSGLKNLLSGIASWFERNPEVEDYDLLDKRTIFKALDRKRFIETVNIRVGVEPNYKGDRNAYLDEVGKLSKMGIEYATMYVDDLASSIEKAYSLGTIDNINFMPPSNAVVYGKLYDKLMKNFMTRGGDSAKIGEMFSSTADIKKYVTNTLRVRSDKRGIEQLAKGVDKVQSRLRDLRDFNKKGGKGDVKLLSARVMLVADLVAKTGKVQYLLDNNLGMAIAITDALTKKKTA